MQNGHVISFQLHSFDVKNLFINQLIKQLFQMVAFCAVSTPIINDIRFYASVCKSEPFVIMTTNIVFNVIKLVGFIVANLAWGWVMNDTGRAVNQLVKLSELII